ncbi:hypothetical protein HK405_012900, partial [Cladochytrium tenue]
DDNVEEAELIEYFNPNELIFNAKMKPSTPFRARDYALLRVAIFDSSTSTHYVLFTSVTDDQVPENPGYARAHMYVNGWIIGPAPPSSTTILGSTLVTHVLHVALGAPDEFPPAVAKMQSIRSAMCVANVADYLRTHGVPTHVRVVGNSGEGLRVELHHDLFDPLRGVYSLAYRVVRVPQSASAPPRPPSGFAGAVEIGISRTVYPAGADLRFIRVAPAGTAATASADSPAWSRLFDVRVTPDARAIRVIPRTAAADGDAGPADAFPLDVLLECHPRPLDPDAAVGPAGPRERLFTVNGDVVRVFPAAGSRRPNGTAAAAQPPPATTPPATPVGGTDSGGDRAPTAPTAPRPMPVAVGLALASLLLSALTPVIGGQRGVRGPDARPLEPLTLLDTATPPQLAALAAAAAAIAAVLLHALLGPIAARVAAVLLAAFSPAQWLLLAGVAAAWVLVSRKGAPAVAGVVPAAAAAAAGAAASASVAAPTAAHTS